jgi:pimeloyl-ACP methyl ester carboxylesterase
MKRLMLFVIMVLFSGLCNGAFAEVRERVVDIPARPGVTQRFLYLLPERPAASVILFAGGHGGLQLAEDGSMKWGKGNFLVRTRRRFAKHGLAVVVVDAPSDRQSFPFLDHFRQTPEHIADIKAIIAWLKKQNKLPVWLVGTSRGTQSAAFIATHLGVRDGGPDGLVLTSTILTDKRARAVPEMALESLTIPVLVVHHEQDGCKVCPYSDIPFLMKKLTHVPSKELIPVTGGEDRGDPCEARAHHGFNGNEEEVVKKIADWIRSK